MSREKRRIGEMGVEWRVGSRWAGASRQGWEYGDGDTCRVEFEPVKIERDFEETLFNTRGWILIALGAVDV